MDAGKAANRLPTLRCRSYRSSESCSQAYGDPWIKYRAEQYSSTYRADSRAYEHTSYPWDAVLQLPPSEVLRAKMLQVDGNISQPEFGFGGLPVAMSPT
jgi:hypothetical protein